MSGHPEYSFGAIKAICEIPILSRDMGISYFTPIGFFFANSSAQGLKFENRLDGPKLTLMVDIHAKFQVSIFLGEGCTRVGVGWLWGSNIF